jgi:hypothetical protein
MAVGSLARIPFLRPSPFGTAMADLPPPAFFLENYITLLESALPCYLIAASQPPRINA